MSGGDWEIFLAAEQNNLKKVKELLDKGLDPNIRDTDRGSTPLHWASTKGHIDIIEALINAGADVNAQTNKGRTACHSLIEQKFEKVVLWLVRYCDADPHIPDLRGIEAYDLALPWFQKEIDGR